MLPLQTIVVAVDFSPGSEAALVRAATLAARVGASLHVVTADAGGVEPTATRGDLSAFAEAALGLGAVRGSGSKGAVVDAVAVVGGTTVPDAVVRYVAEVDAGLLVVGTRGMSGLGRLLMGSTAESCVAASPCPVLTVPRGAEAHEPASGAPVLVAVDFGGLSREALVAGRALADLHGAELRAVHVVRDLGPYAGLSPSVTDLFERDPERAAAVRRRLERFAATAGIPVDRFHVALGPPSRQAPAVAAAVGAGVLVLGTHARTGVSHAMLGSTAESTLRRASCAVLTVRTGPATGAPRRRMCLAAVGP